MNILQIVLGALVGTSFMTFFSYAVSRNKDKQFREPEVLNELLSRAKINFTPLKESPPGWILHYSTGLLFVIGYHLFWELSGIDPSLLNGAIIGAVNGVVGVAIWIITFSVHSNPPDIDIKDYYGHLLIAHIVLGFGVSVGYLLPVWLS